MPCVQRVVPRNPGETAYPGATLLEQLGKRQSLDAEGLLSKQKWVTSAGRKPWGFGAPGVKWTQEINQDRRTIFLTFMDAQTHDIKTSRLPRRAVTALNPGLWGPGPERLLLLEGVVVWVTRPRLTLSAPRPGVELLSI